MCNPTETCKKYYIAEKMEGNALLVRMSNARIITGFLHLVIFWKDFPVKSVRINGILHELNSYKLEDVTEFFALIDLHHFSMYNKGKAQFS